MRLRWILTPILAIALAGLAPSGTVSGQTAGGPPLSVSGTVTAVDANAGTLSVDGIEMRTAEQFEADLDMPSLGAEVTVHYRQSGEDRQVIRIDQDDVPQ